MGAKEFDYSLDESRFEAMLYDTIIIMEIRPICYANEHHIYPKTWKYPSQKRMFFISSHRGSFPCQVLSPQLNLPIKVVCQVIHCHDYQKTRKI